MSPISEAQEAVERQFYGAALDKAKSGSASTGYGLPINQQMRFDEWKRHVADRYRMDSIPFSLLDIGCGTGDLVDYMDGFNLNVIRYEGWDIMPEMVEQAQKRIHDDQGKYTFRTYDVRDKRFPIESIDHVVSIAAYALKAPHDSQQENIRYVQESIEEMAMIATKSVFVSLFSTWKTNIIPEEMVLDPVTMFAWAKSKWERVDLIHSYAPFDFSLVIHLEDSPWRQEWQRQQ